MSKVENKMRIRNMEIDLIEELRCGTIIAAADVARKPTIMSPRTA